MSLSDPEGFAARILRSRWTLPLAVILVGAGCLVATWPFWDNRVGLEATGTYVSLTAAEPRELEVGTVTQGPVEIQILAAQFEGGLPPELQQAGGAARSLHVHADRLIIQQITLGDGSQLTLARATAGRAELRLVGAASVRLSLGGQIRQVAQDGKETTFAPDVPVVLTAEPRSPRDPLRLIVVAAEPLALAIEDLRVKGLRFVRPRPGTGSQPRPVYRSELSGGKLQLLDTGKTIELEARDIIWFEELSGTINRMALTNEGIAVDMVGTANAISLGPQTGSGDGARGQRELTPTILAYVLGRHDLKLLWATGLGILVSLWKARQWALKFAG